jgi:hypothetical protein
LKGIFRLVGVGQNAPANSPDHRPVPVDQGREGRFCVVHRFSRLGAPGGEPLEELAVGEPRRRSRHEKGAKLAKQGGRLSVCHDLRSRRDVRCARYYYAGIEDDGPGCFPKNNE